MESRITKDTPLKIFLNTDCLLITLQFAILHLITHWKTLTTYQGFFNEQLQNT